MAKETKKKNQAAERDAQRLQVFGNSMFGALRVVVTEGRKTMFNLADVCRALEINNPRQAKTRLDQRGVITADTPTENQYGVQVTQQMTYIDEANLYRCIFQSRKTEAKEFQNWVFGEVLPQIRQTGGFIPTRNLRTGEQLTDKEVVEVANKIMARTIARANLPADDCVTATDIALCLGMTVKQLNHQLVDKGVQYKQGPTYKLTGKYADCGYSEERTFHYYALDGEKKERSYMVWTPEGKKFVESLFTNN